MLPAAPDLSESGAHWNDRELFWIVQNGIKYTGMPAWAAVNRHDEIWALIAFLKELPALDALRYRALAIGDVEADAIASQAIATCASCHGGSISLPRSRLVPILHGQPAAYLAQALKEYADGTRHSGIMQPIATDLPPGSIDRLARYYAGLRPPQAPDVPAFTHDVGAGERLAREGSLSKAIPPCLSCHGRDALDTYPRLAGQNPRYLAERLRRYRDGEPEATGGAAIMRPIAERLTDQQIRDLSAYFAGARESAAGR
jgi:cytochrome c553